MHVLIVEDDRMIRDILRSVLEGRQAAVSEAGSRAQALELLQGGAFDAVLLDNGLPDAQGVRFLPEVLKFCRRVIMVTADADRIREHALSLGAETVVSKPFDARGLAKYVCAEWKANGKPDPPH